MSDELFHKIIREGKAMGVRRFVPFLNGEPFANPKIFDWLDYMQSEGVSTCLFTNAELLDDEKIAKLAKYKNIEYINCSFNAATEATRLKVMPDSHFQKTKENIDKLIAAVPYKVKVGMTVVADNVQEKQDFRKLWGWRTKFGDFVNWAGSKHDTQEKIGDRVPCYQLLTHLDVLWDGRVCLCCFDFDGQVILGDLNKQSLREIWDNAELIRQKHRNLEFDLPLCKECNNNAHKLKFVQQ